MTSDETIRKVAEVVDGILGADPQVARELYGYEASDIARALAEAGLLAPAPHIVEMAEGIRNCSKTHGWHTRQALAASMFQLVDMILGPDPDPLVPIMIPTPDNDDWDF